MTLYAFLFFLFSGFLGCHAQELTYEQMKDSLALANENLAKQPDNVDLRLKKASWNMMLMQWGFAQKEYDDILKKYPDNISALYFRAYTFMKQGKYREARDDYKHVLNITPRNFDALLGLALVNQKDFKYTDALNDINLLVQQYPDSAVAYAARAGIELERNMLTLAEYDFTQALRLDSRNTDYLLNRFDVRIKMGRKKEAREDLDLMVALGVPKAALLEYYEMCK
jgi:Tfp pilus assembly protein PilF